MGGAIQSICRTMMKAKPTDNADEWECKHCGETSDELVAKRCKQSSMGFHHWTPTDPSNNGGTGATIYNSEAGNDEWKTMGSDEAKRNAGYTQIDGLVWEQSDSADMWNADDNKCPACGAGRSKQMVVARPSEKTTTEMSLPDRVVECQACGVEWED